MTSIVIGLGVVLVIAVLYMIFKIGNLVGLVKEKKERIDSYNSFNAIMFMVFSIVSITGFLWYSYTHFSEYTLPVASDIGLVTDHLFWVTMAVTVVAFVIISIVMFWFTYKYRYNANRRADFISDNHTLELIWTIVPAIVLALLIFRGLSAWTFITGPAKADAEIIELVGQQFAWTARYPGVKDNQLGHVNYKLTDASNEFGLDLTDKNSFDDFKSLTLHLPVGREVLLKIRAKDVLHSVFLPHFRAKMDAVPGMITQFKFTPTLTTAQMRAQLNNPNFNYEMACTEICGRGHFSMKFPVVVEEIADYEKWKASQESWLKQNPDYLKRVPAELREAAMIQSGLPVTSEAAASVTTVSAN